MRHKYIGDESRKAVVQRWIIYSGPQITFLKAQWWIAAQHLFIALRMLFRNTGIRSFRFWAIIFRKALSGFDFTGLYSTMENAVINLQISIRRAMSDIRSSGVRYQIAQH
jgi:hypothetical protein